MEVSHGGMPLAQSAADPEEMLGYRCPGEPELTFLLPISRQGELLEADGPGNDLT